METNNNNYPTPDFFNFKVYELPELSTLATLDAQKSIVVLLKGATEEELLLLSKIFKAVGKDLAGDGNVINSGEVPPFKTIVSTIEVKKMLIFGINPHELGLHMHLKAYQLVSLQGCELLFSHNLKTIAADLEKKKLLWGQLQIMFSNSQKTT